MKPETRDNLNLGFTAIAAIMSVIGVITIPLAYGYFNARLDTQTASITGHTDAAVSALKQDTTEKLGGFETKIAHDADIEALKDVQKRTFDRVGALAQAVTDNHYETSLQIQRLQDAVNNNVNSVKPPSGIENKP